METKWCQLKLLVTGASGLFGSKLAELAIARNFEVYSGYSRDKPACGTPIQFDVSSKKQVEEAFGEVNMVADNGATNYYRVDWFTPDGLRTWGDGRTFILRIKG